jgi:hypothetical protein
MMRRFKVKVVVVEEQKKRGGGDGTIMGLGG